MEKAEQTPRSFRMKLEENARLLEVALDKTRELEALTSPLYLKSLNGVHEEIKSLYNFYSFLLTTNSPVVHENDLGYFSVLPAELILWIFSYLGYKELCRICRVCKMFNLLVDDDVWRQLCIQMTLPVDLKPKQTTWKWLCVAEKRIWAESDFKDGAGTIFYPKDREKGDSSKYVGDWRENKRHGFGTYYWGDNSFYTGEWKEDKREGIGTRVWPNGNKYSGEYQNHRRHGNGEFSFSNGSLFTGKFEDNKFIYGTYTWPNGRVYTGEWNNIFRHGHGTYYWPDGRSYIGQWKDDKRHGHGAYIWANGDKYEGIFVEGRRWGKGVLKLASGEIYDQNWREVKFDENEKGIPPGENITEWNIGQNSVKATCRKRKNDEMENVANTPAKFSRSEADMMSDSDNTREENKD